MQYDGDYRSYYAPDYPPPVNPSASGFPSPNPVQPAYASAPPYSDLTAYSVPPSATAPADPCYASYVQNPEPASELPPPASSYAQTQPQFPTFQAYNPSAYPPEPMPTPSQHYTYDPDVQAATYSPLMNPGSAPPFDAPLPLPLQSYGSSAGLFDRGAGYLANDAARYGSPVGEGYDRSLPSFEQDTYGKRPESSSIPYNGGFGDCVYAYDGGRSEPYGARGTVPGRSQVLFDDYGRSLNLPSSEKDGGSLGRIVRAVPAGTQQDAKNGVQKFRVKLLPEGGGQSTMDVLCQIGLDGIRMLDPSTSRTLRIYPLETVTRWEVIDSSTFTFWSKSSVDNDPKRIMMQSNSYTTNTLLDTVTAATVQLKEMGGNDSLNRDKISSNAGISEQATEKKKGLIDWVNLMKPANEEKDHWVPDETVRKCTSCGSDFGAFNRRHHCRNCGDIFCDKCTQGRIALTADENAQLVRVCDSCMAEVSQRLSNTKEAANKPVGVHSHEDFARKLQEEMEKSPKSSSGSKSSDGSERQTMEVACPICTVHLRVQVPTSGSETIECGVCQHPFLVGAH